MRLDLLEQRGIPRGRLLDKPLVDQVLQPGLDFRGSAESGDDCAGRGAAIDRYEERTEPVRQAVGVARYLVDPLVRFRERCGRVHVGALRADNAPSEAP